MQRISVIIAVILLGFTLGAWAQDTEQKPLVKPRAQELTPAPLPATGDTLRDFVFFDYQQKLHKLYEHRGKPVLLFFWVPGDANCIKALEELSARAANGDFGEAVLYAIEISAKTGDALMLLASNDYAFTFLEGDYPFVVERYGVTGVPTFFLVDRMSKMVQAYLGYDDSTADKIISALKEIR